MSSKWNEYKLSEVCTITSSKRIFAHDYVDSGIPFYRSKDVIDKALGTFVNIEIFISESRFNKIADKFGYPREGDLLLSSVGNRSGIPYVVKKEGKLYFKDGNLTWFKDFNCLNSLFLYYWLISNDGQNSLNSIMIGSAQKALTISGLLELKIKIPDIESQNKIVLLLRSLDDRISLLREINTTLGAIAQALFKSWFVNFDPVHAKQEGCEPEGMDAAIAALFPSSFVESELGMIPAGWHVGKVEHLMELAYGKALKASDRTSGQVPVYGSGGITGLHNEALVNGPSIVVGRKGTVGSLYWEDRPLFPIDTVFYVKAKLPLTYCFYQLDVLGLEKMNTDGAVPGLNRNNVYRLPVVVPGNPVIEAFDDQVALLRKRIFVNVTHAQTLSALRDSLLPRLISGQLRLSDAELLIEAVAA
jgi:type I restriction enzyme, S subunit